MKNKNIATVILAGGKNSRFSGFNKAFLKINGKKIVDLQLDILRNIFSEVIIVSNNNTDFAGFCCNITIVNDIVKNCGPIGGIYTGLKTINTDCAFFVACDMLIINKNLIQKIVKLSENIYTVVPYSEKGVEPLFAVYNKEVIPYIENAISTKKLSVGRIIEKIPCRYLKLTNEEIRSLININTYSDFCNAKRYLRLSCNS